MSGFRRGLMANAAIDPLKVPLTFTAAEAGAVIVLSFRNMDAAGIYYRTGTTGSWLPVSDSDMTENGQYKYFTVTTLNGIGDKVQFWNANDRLGTAYNVYTTFTFSKQVSASGNIQSMLNWRNDVPDRSFGYLFSGQTNLIDVSNLLMPATSYGNYSCQQMFYNTRISKAPKFAKSISFTADGAFAKMFWDCADLSEIRCPLTAWTVPYQNTTFDWVSGVPAGGIFYKPSALPEEYGINRIPEGWTVVNID